MRFNIKRLSIRGRLFLLALLLSGVILSLAAYLNNVAGTHIDAIDALASEQQELYAVEALRYDITRFIDLLEARAIAAQAMNDEVTKAFNDRIGRESQRLSTQVRQLAETLKSEDLFLVNVYLKDIETAYERSLQEGAENVSTSEAMAAERLERIRTTLLKIADVELAQSATVADTISSFADSYQLATWVVITVLVVSIVIILLFILSSISRPLNSVFDAIANIDAPNAVDLVPSDGPSEFVQMSAALRKHFETIEARRAAEEKLVESEARFRDFAEASADIFWETDRALQFSWFGGEEGVLPETLKNGYGKSLWEIANINTHSDPRWRLLQRTMKARKTFRNFEFRLTSHDLENSVWWQFSGAPYSDETGDFAGYRGVALDVTGNKEVEAHLQRSQNREVIAQITSGVAHDFNNLLAVLQSNLDLVTRKADLPEKFGAMLERCSRAARRGSRLTGQLLSLSRRQELNPEPINVDIFFDDFVSFIRRTLPDNVDIQLSVAAFTPHIFADQHYLQDALLNIAINARDAMPEGGQLSIETREASEPAAEARLEKMVEICIRDTGSGIPDHIRERIFDPFFSTKGAGGTGLGLSMVRGFVEQSGGAIDLESQASIGTKVCLTFPAAPTALNMNAAEDGKLINIDPLRILLVEDEEDVRLTIASVLEDMGHTVTLCENGDCAAQLLTQKRGQFDLVISDIMMPGALQGDDLAHLVHGELPQIPIILMSGYARDKQGRKRALPPGTPLLPKPIDATLLSKTIAAVCTRTLVKAEQK